MIEHEQYYRKGGTYELPIEIYNDLIGQIEEAQKERNNYKSRCENLIQEKDKEIERLNNIINELEKYLENVKTNLRYIGVKWDNDCLIRAEVIQQVLHKLKELKESGNNE